MIGLGLSAAQLKQYSTALRSSHAVRVRVSLMDGDENHAAEFATTSGDDRCPISVIGGQVDIDTTAGASASIRKLTLSLVDPKRKLAVGLNTPGDYAVWANTFLRVERGDFVRGLDGSRGAGGYVYCPVFTGPILTFERKWPEVTITATGKEYLAQAPYGVPTSITIKKGTNVRTAIVTLMTALGESNFALTRTTQTIGGTDVVVPAFAAIWPVCLKFAALAGLQLFYDGSGALRMEPRNKTNTVWAFNANPSTGMLLSAPDVVYDFTGGQALGGQVSAGSGAFANYVDVTGRAPTKTVPQPHAVATAAASNDLSPQALARHGKPRYAIIAQSNSTMSSQADAQSTADKIFDAAIELATTATFDAMPVPHLEEYDWVTVESGDGDLLSVQMNKWSIPLGADAMTVGALRQMAYTKGLRAPRVARKRYPTRKAKSTKGHP